MKRRGAELGKNNRLINSINALAQKKQDENIGKAADEMVPQIYAAVAIALHRTYGFGYERINRVFAESQKIWLGFDGRATEMMELCQKETGVTIIFKNLEE